MVGRTSPHSLRSVPCHGRAYSEAEMVLPATLSTSSGSARPSRDGRRPNRCWSALDRSSCRALGIRIVGDRVGRHAGAISSVEEASRVAEFTRADSAEKSLRRTSGSAGTLRDQDLRLGTGSTAARVMESEYLAKPAASYTGQWCTVDQASAQDCQTAVRLVSAMRRWMSVYAWGEGQNHANKV